MRRVLLSAVLTGVAAASLAACNNGTAAPALPTQSTSSSSSAATTTTTTERSSSAAPTSSSRQTTATTTAKPVVNPPAPGGKCPAFPTPSCTGVPAGTALAQTALNNGGSLRITEPGTVIDGKHVRGDLVINANNVIVRNSQIDGSVVNEDGGKQFAFSISDSTVGPASGCMTVPGIGMAEYTATRVHVRGHGDGFRASGNNIKIDESYVKLCSNPGDHSDGIQTYMAGAGLTLNHTTIDQRSATSVTAPIDIMDPGASDVTITDNLVMGGTYSIYFRNASGTRIVQNNRVVDKSWIYGPVEADCGAINWSGNTLVTIDANYNVTSTVGPLNCK